MQTGRIFNESGRNELSPYLGVTEAGEGEDARIKSAIGIGSLLLDGLGDTIRVSLTEDPVAEIPVAKDLAKRAHETWNQEKIENTVNRVEESLLENCDRRPTPVIKFGRPAISFGEKNPPRVISSSSHSLTNSSLIIQDVAKTQVNQRMPPEGLLVTLTKNSELENLETVPGPYFRLFPSLWSKTSVKKGNSSSYSNATPFVWLSSDIHNEVSDLAHFLAHCEQNGHYPAIRLNTSQIKPEIQSLLSISPQPPIVTLPCDIEGNSISNYRKLAYQLNQAGLKLPIWIRNHDSARFSKEDYFSGRMLDASILSGSLLCDGIGDLISVENLDSLNRNRSLTYNILQGSRARISKTEFMPVRVVVVLFLTCKALPKK